MREKMRETMREKRQRRKRQQRKRKRRKRRRRRRRSRRRMMEVMMGVMSRVVSLRRKSLPKPQASFHFLIFEGSSIGHALFGALALGREWALPRACRKGKERQGLLGSSSHITQ